MKLYIDENNRVVTMHEATSDMKCFEEFENRKPYSFSIYISLLILIL